MDDLGQWLTTQLDEDEQTARAATPGPWEQGGVGDFGWTVNFSRRNSGAETEDSEEGYADAAFIAEWDPARVLREIDAKRKLIAEHPSINVSDLGSDCGTCVWPDTVMAAPWPCPTLRLLALPYADREGYQESWHP